MRSAKKIKVDIQRYDPDRDPPTYIQSYEVAYHASMTVLEVLEALQYYQDDSLAFRSSCRSSKCGTCAVSLNGKSSLACKTVVDGNDLSIAPLPKRPVVRDLIISDKAREDRLQKLAQGDAVAASIPQRQVDYANISRCIECTICTASCPIGLEMGSSMAPTPDMLSAVVGAGIQLDDVEAIPIEGNVDYCSLCLNCYLACPAGVNLNELNAQAKHSIAAIQSPRLRQWLLGRPDLLGKLGSLTPKLSNLGLSVGILRKGMDAVVGISADADMPAYEVPFRQWFEKYKRRTPETAKHKAAFFVGCFNSYNDTQPAKDTVMLLDQLGIYVDVPPQECCGMPMLGNGDLDGARQRAISNLTSFQPWLNQGFDVITTCSTGSLMLKSEYTRVLGLAAAETLASRTHDMGEYLQKLLDADELDLGNLTPVPEKMSYHTPCHLKVQKIGTPFVDLLEKIPAVEIDVMDAACCGMSGSYGFKTEKHEISMDVGQHLFDAINKSDPDLTLSECGSCQLQMQHGTGKAAKHPVSVLLEAVKK